MEQKSKFFLKFVLTIIAFYILFHKVSISDISHVLKNTDIKELFFAFIAFNVSKITSAFRLNTYFKIVDINLNEIQNIKLYYIGMFYNLFLPGGIGGDGYKIYLLKKSHKTSTKSLIIATLLDRISGLIPLVILMLLFFQISIFKNISTLLNILSIVAIVLLIPISYRLNKKFFPIFLPKFSKTLFYGFGVQLFQLLSAYFILLSLHIDNHLVEYLLFFLLSSIVAVLPLTVGGAGARELVFLYGLEYIKLNSATGVAFAMIFFLISSISSLIGAIFKNPIEK